MVLMMICVPTAPLYKSPDINSEHTDEALFGMTCEVLESTDGFYKVNMFYGYEGYIEKPFICEQLHEPNSMVSVSFSDLLPDSRNFFRPVMTLPQGALLDVGFSEKYERYGFVILPNKRIYYIHKKHIKPLPFKSNKSETELRGSIVANALSYLGTQYRWGGKTHAGIDCSGLAFMAYYLSGILIYRDADISKSPNVRRIRFNDAKAGDLIYFPGHMAVYLGDGEYVHSSAREGQVCIGSFCPDSDIYDDWLAKNISHTGTVFNG
ncbi:MAG: C40 family peptidase [Eubacteriales bacterium]|nr:C40 family peptidase [Eubacteriales bacterium]MDD4421936.1 C40 family peptidase [Eubacteriales bacterium]HBR31127.1 glycoside hydrolase [Clostridiales bacterium]